MSETAHEAVSKRYLALDCFRGLTIALMILVNSPGSWSYVYAPLLHARWNGLTPTDLVFPFFLFIVGASMVFAMSTKHPLSYGAMFIKLSKRSLLLIVIGLALNAYPFVNSFDELRLPGVLQCIGISYFFAGLLVYYLSTKARLAVCAIALVAYQLWLLDYSLTSPLTVESNPIRDIDLIVFGVSHMWHVGQVAFDPEGLMSSICAVVSLVLGYEVTRLLVQSHDSKSGLMSVLKSGAVCVLLGLGFAYFLPINKSLWTPAYALVCAGLASWFLGACVYWYDLKRSTTLSYPLVVYGSNPLFAYVLSWIVVATGLFIEIDDQNLQALTFSMLNEFLTPKLSSLVYALFNVVLVWLVALALYRRKIFIRI